MAFSSATTCVSCKIKRFDSQLSCHHREMLAVSCMSWRDVLSCPVFSLVFLLFLLPVCSLIGAFDSFSVWTSWFRYSHLDSPNVSLRFVLLVYTQLTSYSLLFHTRSLLRPNDQLLLIDRLSVRGPVLPGGGDHCGRTSTTFQTRRSSSPRMHLTIRHKKQLIDMASLMYRSKVIRRCVSLEQ